MIGVEDFETPTHHPYSMLCGHDNANQKEGFLAWALNECIKLGSLKTIIVTKYPYPEMVDDGLLAQHGEIEYSLTTKSIGLLYSVYGKEPVAEVVQP